MAATALSTTVSAIDAIAMLGFLAAAFISFRLNQKFSTITKEYLTRGLAFTLLGIAAGLFAIEPYVAYKIIFQNTRLTLFLIASTMLLVTTLNQISYKRLYTDGINDGLAKRDGKRYKQMKELIDEI